MKYKATNKINAKIWNEFVLTHPLGNIFQSHEFYNIYKNSSNCIPIMFAVIDEKSETLHGLMLSVIQTEGKRLLGYCTARSIIIGGPLIHDNNLKVLDLLLNEYNKTVGNKVIYSQFRNQWHWSEKEKIVFHKYGFIYEPHLDIIHDLSLPIEKQWLKIHKGRRKNIQRAQNKGVNIREASCDEDLEIAYKLVQSTYKRVGLPLPKIDFFFNSFKILIEKGNLKVFLAMLKEEAIASRLVLCFKGIIYDWYAGSNDNYINYYPNDYLPWAIFEWCSSQDYIKFDFGGAGKPNVPYGVRDYKLKFGGKLVEYGRFEKIHKPLLMSIGKMGMKLYSSIMGEINAKNRK